MKSIIDDTMPFASEHKRKANGDVEEMHRDAYNAWKTSPTNATRGGLLKSVAPVIDRAVFTYAGAKPSPTVKSQARLMAIKAFDTYDPAKGSMKNHLMGTLRGLQRYAGQQSQIISIPERVALDKRHLMDAEEYLRDQFGRDPSDMELADHTGLALKRIGYIRGAASGVASGSMLDEEGEVYSPPSSIPGSTSREDSLRQMIYYDLDDTDRTIMDYTLGANGVQPLTTGEIARRLGITAGAVSQRKNKIQSMVDEAWQLDILGGE